MGKVAWVFPGQGAQFAGMGAELVKDFAVASDVFETAEKVLGKGFTKVIFDGPDGKLTLTKNAQPAILAVGVACARVAFAKGLSPDMAAGLSLGEFTALVVAGSLELGEALEITYKRGTYMQEACPEGEGAMVAVLGFSCAEVDALCYSAKRYGVVVGANYNCPGQVVVSGHKKAVEAVSEMAKRQGKRTVQLYVSAPFHSPLMAPAAVRLAKDLEKVRIKAPRYPIYVNVTGDAVTAPEDIKSALIRQVTFPVLWQTGVESMLRDGASLFIEMGPGKSLTGFLKRISPATAGATFLTTGDLASIIELSKKAVGG